MYQYLKKTKKMHFNCVNKSKLKNLINKNENSNLFVQKYQILKNQNFLRNNLKFHLISNFNSFKKKVLTIQLYFIIQNKLKNKKDLIFHFIFLYKSLFDLSIKHKKIVCFFFKISFFLSILFSKKRIERNINKKKLKEFKKNKIYILKFLIRKKMYFFYKTFSFMFYKKNQKISFTFTTFFIKNGRTTQKKIQSQKKQIKIFLLKAKNFIFFRPSSNFMKFLLNFSQFSFKEIQFLTIQEFGFFKKNLKKQDSFFIKNFLNNDLFFRFHNKIFLNNILLSISNKTFFLKKNFSIFTFKKFQHLRQLKKYSFLKKNQFQFILNLKQVFYFLEMISFLSKKMFYNKRKKFLSFISKKFLWNHFILKKKAFLTFFSILFSKKFNFLKKKDAFLKIFYHSQFLILKKKFQNNLNKRMKNKKIKNETIEMFLESFKFGFYFEFYGNFSDSYAFNCFIKEFIKTTKKQFLLYDCFSFYKKKISLFLLNCFLKRNLIKNNQYYFFLLNKENFIIFSENFFFVLKQLIKTLKKTNNFSKILQIKNNFFLRKSVTKFKFFLNAIIKTFYQDYKNTSNHSPFCKIDSNFKLKKQNSIFKQSFGFLKFIFQKYRKQNHIGFYYGSFLFNFNMNIFDFFLIFYQNFCIFPKEKTYLIKKLNFDTHLRKKKIYFSFLKKYIVSNNIPNFLKFHIFKYLFQTFFLKKKFNKKKYTQSIFFAYKKDLNKKSLFFNDFKKFFFNFSFFRIYKVLKIKKKVFLVEKWDQFLGKNKYFLKQNDLNISKNIWINHSKFSFYNKNYFKKIFLNKFTTLLIFHKNNLIIFSTNNVILNKIFLWYEPFHINDLFHMSFFKNAKKLLSDRKKTINLVLKNEIFFKKIKFFKETRFNFKGFLFFISNKENSIKENCFSFQNALISNNKNFFLSLERLNSLKNNKYLLNQKDIFLLKKMGIKNYFFQFLNLKNNIGLIPSKRFVKKHLNILRKILFKYNSQGQLKIIYKCTLKIQHWCYYYRIVTDSQIFYYCDKIIYKLLWKWACYQHPNKSKKWIQKKYFFSLKNKKWIFGMIPKDFDSESSIKKIFYLPFHNFLIQI